MRRHVPESLSPRVLESPSPRIPKSPRPHFPTSSSPRVSKSPRLLFRRPRPTFRHSRRSSSCSTCTSCSTCSSCSRCRTIPSLQPLPFTFPETCDAIEVTQSFMKPTMLHCATPADAVTQNSPIKVSTCKSGFTDFTRKGYVYTNVGRVALVF